MHQVVVVSVLVAASVCLMGLPASARATSGEYDDSSEQQHASQNNHVQNFIGHFARSSTVPCRHHYRELANYLVELAKEAMAKASDSQPCERKRNSELINSLLGLPKTMNDAGRK